MQRITGEPLESLREHARLLQNGEENYLKPEEFLSQNTDGAGNPLARVYSRREALELFKDFSDVNLQTHFLNKRWPPSLEFVITLLDVRSLRVGLALWNSNEMKIWSLVFDLVLGFPLNSPLLTTEFTLSWAVSAKFQDQDQRPAFIKPF